MTNSRIAKFRRFRNLAGAASRPAEWIGIAKFSHFRKLKFRFAAPPPGARSVNRLPGKLTNPLILVLFLGHFQFPHTDRRCAAQPGQQMAPPTTAAWRLSVTGSTDLGRSNPGTAKSWP